MNHKLNTILRLNQNATHFASMFINQVFLWMSFGLMLTSVISYWVAHDVRLMALVVGETGLTGFGYVVLFAPIGFVLLMSLGFKQLSYGMLLFLFIVYAAIMGMSLSVIFLIYTESSIYSTFGIAALMFGGMAMIGYITKTDLTKIGNVLLMVLIGIVVASLVNLFLQSDAFTFLISLVSVVVFAGLTAYDIQKIKQLANEVNMEEGMKKKIGIIGALTLYLDFINLFLSLLHFFGNKKET